MLKRDLLLATLLGIVLAAAGSGIGFAADITADNVASYIAKANTPRDHEAIASFYESEAKAAKDKAADYKAQFDSYTRKKMGKRTGAQTDPIVKASQYCKLLSAHYERIARADEALAAAQRDLAKSAGGGEASATH
jgi:hypothetical protein